MEEGERTQDSSKASRFKIPALVRKRKTISLNKKNKAMFHFFLKTKNGEEGDCRHNKDNGIAGETEGIKDGKTERTKELMHYYE